MGKAGRAPRQLSSNGQLSLGRMTHLWHVWDAALSRCRRRPQEKERVVWLNRGDLAAGPDGNGAPNTMNSSLYSFAGFLPCMLYEQFSAPMNLFFLMIACLQLWRAISPVSVAASSPRAAAALTPARAGAPHNHVDAPHCRLHRHLRKGRGGRRRAPEG
jgi:hypothetical protein